MSIKISTIFRYPVKGLSPELLEKVRLSAAQCIPYDRRFALARASTLFDPQHPEWLPKTNFYMLMRDEKLAQLSTHFDESSGFLTIEHHHQPLLRASLTDPAGREQIAAFFNTFLENPAEGPPRVVDAPGHAFSDARKKPNSTTYQYISLINLASITELEQRVRSTVDPLRFRANIYFEGTPAWSELSWVNSEIELGNTRLHVVSPITRCAATTVNPATAQRDLAIPSILHQEYGHNHMGIYAEVMTDGEIARGDLITLL